MGRAAFLLARAALTGLFVQLLLAGHLLNGSESRNLAHLILIAEVAPLLMHLTHQVVQLLLKHQFVVSHLQSVLDQVPKRVFILHQKFLS